MKALVIFHASCVDGFAAAWAAWRKFGDEADYVPAHYGEPAPEVTGREVVIVDFSFPRAALLEMKEKAASLRVLDHHKSAAADLEGLDFCTFDMNRSGAGIAWDELVGGERPKLIDYVQDRDLWRFNLPRSREVSAWLSSWSRSDFHCWSLLAADLANDFPNCVAQGNAILRGVVDQYVDGLVSKGRPTEIGGHVVPCINTTHAQSELVGKLAESATFAAGWFQREDGKFIYSLRSRGDFDVSEIAKMYGGGGHAAAAGFQSDVLLPAVKA